MKLFELIHNYQLQALLATTKTNFYPYVVDGKERIWIKEIAKQNIPGPFPLTLMEKSWLKFHLSTKDSTDFLTDQLRSKIERLLADVPVFPFAELVDEKGANTLEARTPSHYRLLRHLIRNKQGMQITYCTKAGHTFSYQLGIPWKLEFSMSKRQWYLLWIKYENNIRIAMTTPFDLICNILPKNEDNWSEHVNWLIAERKRNTRVLSVKLLASYNDDRQRVLYAFSCFEKDIIASQENGELLLRIVYLADEEDYVLSKIRSFGKRLMIVQPERLRERIKDTAVRALARYK